MCIEIEFYVKLKVPDTNKIYNLYLFLDNIRTMEFESDEMLIESVDSSVIELKRLEGKVVNVYELYMLADAMEYFIYQNEIELSAHIYNENLMDLKDLINAAVAKDKYVLLQRFPYELTIHDAREVYSRKHPEAGGYLENGSIDYLREILDRNPVIMTPYGYVVQLYEQTKQAYDGVHMRNFKMRSDEDCIAYVTDQMKSFEFCIPLPVSNAYLQSVLEKANIEDLSNCKISYENYRIPEPLWMNMDQILKKGMFSVNHFLTGVSYLELDEDVHRLEIACGILQAYSDQSLDVIMQHLCLIDDCNVLEAKTPIEYVKKLADQYIQGNDSFMIDLFKKCINYQVCVGVMQKTHDFINIGSGMLYIPTKEQMDNEFISICKDCEYEVSKINDRLYCFNERKELHPLQTKMIPKSQYLNKLCKKCLCTLEEATYACMKWNSYIKTCELNGVSLDQMSRIDQYYQNQIKELRQDQALFHQQEL